MTEFKELSLSLIREGSDRARPLDPLVVEALAASIREQGLLQPIVVREVDDAYHLVAGWHRLEAVRSLGRDEITVRVLTVEGDTEAKLAEVMENLGRGELIALDRCHHLYDLKQVWERMYPETAHGKASPKSQTLALSSDAPEVFGFARATAERIGLSVSTIKAAVKIWTGLVPSVRTRLHGTDLAHKQTELKALSELPATKQIKVLDAIMDKRLPDIGNVAQALEHLSGTIACDPIEKRFATVSKTFAALDDATFDSVIAAHEDRVITSLKRRGRI